MKTKYFKRFIAVGFIALLSLSSCLKDSRYFNPESVTSNVAELPLSGLANFTKDAVTKSGIDTITFAVGVTAANPPSTSTTVTIGVDNTIITTYNTANAGIVYQAIPTAAFKLPLTSVTIPAGQNSTLATVIVDRNQLDPTASYMLPIKIVNAGGITVSANFGVHYYHIIGNDFAGPYFHDFVRIPAVSFATRMDTFFPDSPTQFEVNGGYYTADIRYVVSFTKTGSGASAMYSNFNISLNADDVARIALVPIAISTAPSIKGYVAGQSYTFAQALALFAAPNGFTYGANGTRINTDTYHK